ncbi:MAG: 2-amino-4-hydroxy-6-hydroxymethyldihydropteridine diphosphokinase [Gammaproteobacteria bacterium]|nr:2-amino-4-hydroxy-6-hydroxymethyldihydropteridine diphosphokinase [Gammaproteobacteria bacterium]
MLPEKFVEVYVGLGSNLNHPIRQIEEAFQNLSNIPSTRVLKVSPLYQSKPLGPPLQPDYINAVVLLLTELSPPQLMEHLQSIEKKQGRIKTIPWGPRTIDCDLLLYGTLTLKTDALQIPHPGLKLRAFVLKPLLDIAPDLVLPDGTSILEAYLVLKKMYLKKMPRTL